MFSWIYSWFGGSSSAPTDDSGPFGSFYNTAKPGQWRCLYQKSKPSIRAKKNAFDLVISRVFEEGERELESENGENKLPEEYSFDVSGSMQATIIREPDSQITLLWRDGVTQYKVEFDEEMKTAEFDAFVVEFGKALFTVLNGVAPSAEDATYEKLVTLFEKSEPAPKSAPKSTPKSKSAPKPAPEPASKPAPEPAAVAAAAIPEPAPAPAPAVPVFVPVSEPLPAFVPLPGTVASVPCSLYSYNGEIQSYELSCPRCMAVITEVGPYEFCLSVLDVAAKPAHDLVRQKINNQMNPYFNMSDRSITWSYTLNKTIWVWCIVLPDSTQDVAFKDKFSQCLYETTTHSPFKSVKAEDKSAIFNTLRDSFDDDDEQMDSEQPVSPEEEDKILVAMNSLSLKSKKHGGILEDDDEEDEDEDEDEDEEEDDDDKAKKDEEAEEEEDEERPTRREFRLGSKNRLLNVSSKNHRALVCRGKKIGIFSAENADQGVHFETCISGFKDKSGSTFAPRRTMLHHEEDNLLMLHPENNRNVLQMDLNRGEIVSEWGIDDFPINEILPETKFAPQSLTQTMVGMNRRGFFMMDPRISGKSKMVTDKSFFSLAGKVPGFTCAATTTNGDIVMGTEKGEIRLYDRKMLKEGKPGSMMEDRQPRAKTAFTGFGDPIKGIDVTQDGKWIVATCSTYLLLIKTYNTAGDSGYLKSIGKTKMPPRRLRLKPQHMKLIGDVDFTPAKFDIGEDLERSIVTSTGPYVITWNFRKAKQNRLDYYRIVGLNDGVVADQFRFGDSDNIIVAMPDDVTVAHSVVPEKKR